MKAAILALSFAAGLAFAQDDLGNGVPKCAGPCVLQYTTGGKIAGCATLDIKCVCKNKDFLSGIACCLESACDQAGRDAAVKYAGQICGSAGVDVPDKVECSTGASSAATASSFTAASKASTSSASSTTGSGAAATGSADSATGSSASKTTEESATGTQAEASTSATTSGAAAVLDPASGLVGAAVAMLFAL